MSFLLMWGVVRRRQYRRMAADCQRRGGPWAGVWIVGKFRTPLFPPRRGRYGVAQGKVSAKAEGVALGLYQETVQPCKGDIAAMPPLQGWT